PGVARQAKLSHSLDPRYRYSRPGCGRSSAPFVSWRWQGAPRSLRAQAKDRAATVERTTEATRRAALCMAKQSWAPRPVEQGVARPHPGSHVVRAMRLLPLCIAGCLLAPAALAADSGDQINA